MLELSTQSIELGIPAPFNQGTPHFNGASLFGATPNRQFMVAFPVRGERPIRFHTVTPLPPGVMLSETGVLSGSTEAGEYRLAIVAENAKGSATLEFRLMVGEGMRGRTPLLGWTSWNALMRGISQERILAQAQALVASGLSSRGYGFVNIDSCWQGKREVSKNSSLQPNGRFPEMKCLVDTLHALGLKAGIYSTPMVIALGSSALELLPGGSYYPLDPNYYMQPFGGCGMTHFEKQDARQWEEWGFDYLKYDWKICDVEHTRLMREALDATSRDFLLSLTVKCSLDDIGEYPKYAQMYRSNADTSDRWECVKANLLSADHWLPHTGPGKWFDLDMLALGKVAIERIKYNEFYTTSPENRLTRDEQITHFALWCFLPSPVQLSCDLTALDEFTLNLISNEELLALNQDELGSMSILERDCDGLRIYRRALSVGRTAFAFVNLAEESKSLEYDFGYASPLRDPIAMRSYPSESSVKMLLPPHGTRILIIREEA